MGASEATRSTTSSMPAALRWLCRSSRRGSRRIKANLQVTLRLAAMVAEFELPDEAEPAPVFEA